MEKLLSRIVTIFTIGFLAIGAVLGFEKVGDCGFVFNPSESCASGALAGHLALVIAFLGLGLTGLVAAVMIDVTVTHQDTKTRVEQSDRYADVPHETE